MASCLAGKHELDGRRSEEISALFRLDEQSLSALQGLERVGVKVRLQIMGSIVEVEKEARNMQ